RQSADSLDRCRVDFETAQQLRQLSRRVSPLRERAREPMIKKVVRRHVRSPDEARDDEDSGRDSHSLEKRKGVVIEVAVAVIKGDGGRWLAEALPERAPSSQFVQ